MMEFLPNSPQRGKTAILEVIDGSVRFPIEVVFQNVVDNTLPRLALSLPVFK